MKRLICLVLALLLAAFTLTACNPTVEDPVNPGPPAITSVPNNTPTPQPTPAPTAKPTPEPTAEPTPEPSAEPTPEPTEEQPVVYYHPLTGLPTESDLSGTKPVAVMINNLKQALPQQGISQADIIYEVLAEGGITRMMALYQQPATVGIIGSVRSARLYYFQLAQGHDALYIHAGGSPDFYTAKNNSGITTVDGVVGYYASSGAGVFWRDRYRISGQYYAYEHSLLTSGIRISSILTTAGLLGDHKDGFTETLRFSDENSAADGKSATRVIVPFSNYKTGEFKYDAATGLYAVEEYGHPYVDGNDGSQVKITNLLVLQAATQVMDGEGRLSIDLSSGSGWYACGGRIIPIKWSKGAAGDPLRFFRTDGTELTLSRGKSYICIIPLARDITAD